MFDAAIEFIDEVKAIKEVKIRIGMHSCDSVLGGVLGLHQVRYELFGEAVCFTSEIEQSAQPNTIAVSRAMLARLSKTTDPTLYSIYK